MNKMTMSLLTVLLSVSGFAHASLEDNNQNPASPTTAQIDESAEQKYDFEIQILEPTQATAFMQQNAITEQTLQNGDDTQVASLDRNFRPERAAGPAAQQRNCYARNGVASWYGPGFQGHSQACPGYGAFNEYALTAAHKTIKCGSRVRVTYGGRSVVVVITDAGPYYGGRVIDLSKAAAERLGLSTGYVQLQILSCGR